MYIILKQQVIFLQNRICHLIIIEKLLYFEFFWYQNAGKMRKISQKNTTFAARSIYKR